MNPHIFERMCKTAGAGNFYLSIKNVMWSERMSEERKQFVVFHNGSHLHNVVFTIEKVQFLSSCFIKSTATIWD